MGRPRAEVDLRIVDPAGGDLPTGEVGEVVCRSPAMMRGYWRDPELTATVIDADGWLHTGDLGRLRPDGNLVLAGRLKEMYIRGGYNVYPTEVEAVLTEHPAIARAAVIGAPDPVLGEIGVAFVVPTGPRARGTRPHPTATTLRAGARNGSPTTRPPTAWCSSTTSRSRRWASSTRMRSPTRWADIVAAEPRHRSPMEVTDEGARLPPAAASRASSATPTRR